MKHRLISTLLVGSVIVSCISISAFATEPETLSLETLSLLAESSSTTTGDTKEYNSFTVAGQEVRLFKETTVTEEEAKNLYPNAYSLIAAAAVDRGISPSLENKDFQAYALTFAFYDSDDPKLNQEVINFVKFVDLYENTEKNTEILQAIVSPATYSDDIDDLNIMMPITGPSTVSSDEVTEDSPVSPQASSYDTDAVVAYARAWWDKTNNDDYPYYAEYNGQSTSRNDYNDLDDGLGGQSNPRRAWNDCTNFVSQCLLAGGVPTIKEGLILPYRDSGNWFYDDDKPSHTWGGAPNFYEHWKNRVGVANSSGKLGVGDAVSLDFDGDGDINHTVIIVSSGSKDSSKLLSAHTVDRYRTSYTNGSRKNWSLQSLYDADYHVYGYEIDTAF